MDSANSKGFAINEEGANAYIKVFRDFEDQLVHIRNHVNNAAQTPQLGTSPYAQQTANHTKSMASGDYQSFDVALEGLTEVVQQARQAFEQAKANYTAMEDEAVHTFKGIQH